MKITKEFLLSTANLYGDSFYILDSNNFIESFNDLTSKFKLYYPKSRIAYSYKTNYIPRLCSIVNELEGYAETVSDMEVNVALAVGVHPEKIFLNGPYKNHQSIEDLLLKGGVVNIDSKADLSIICSIASSRPKHILRIGIRCNFDINDGVISRFGFDVSNGDFDRALTEILDYSNIELVGLHCHFASRKLQSWINASKGMLKVIKAVEERNIGSIKYISLGGGLYGKMSLKLQKQLGINPPSFSEYAEAAAKPFANYFKDYDRDNTPELIIEPGTALAANALKFVARVVNIKQVGEKFIATLSGSSFNTNPTSGNVNLPITIFHTDEIRKIEYYEDLDMAGYTCIETDYLYRNYSGSLSVGDFIVFDSAGSYSIVMKPPFIMPNVPILEINENQTVSVLKRQETFEDVFITYKMVF